MTRISLKEAYDNKDVAVQIFSLRDDVARIDEVIENLPNPDLTNCVIKDTEQTITGEKTFTKKIHAEGGIEVNTEGGFEINGPLTVDGDIIQNGQAYETHAEQVFSQNDLIVTRDGAVSALPAGVVSGIQIKKYDGVNDARLAVDNAGVARVGDVGDEQPLMTRAEVADMVGGAFLKWDAVHSKAVSGTLDDAPTAGSSNGVKSSGIKSAIDSVNDSLSSAIAGKVSGTGNIGDDKHPVKIVNGSAVAVSLIDDEVVFTSNSYFVSTVGRHDFRYNGRYVYGFCQLTTNGIPANQEIEIGTVAKPAKYPNGNGQVGLSLGGQLVLVWVNNYGSVRLYSTATISDSIDVAFSLLYEAS